MRHDPGVDDSERELLTKLWEQHRQAPFPAGFHGKDVAGVDIVMLDADVAGCVSSLLAGPLDERRRVALGRCVANLIEVLPAIEDEYGAKYYERLREMAVLGLKPSRNWDDQRVS